VTVMNHPPETPRTHSGPFPPTRWSVVIRARGQGREAGRALDELCGIYWPAVYTFLRRKGKSPADAEDLTQGFFAELLARGSLEEVAEDKGRLRTFLLKAATRHMINQYEKTRATKRGGGVSPLSLDFHSAETRFIPEPGHQITPEREFEKQWALQLLDHALANVRIDAEAHARGALFEDLKGLVNLDAVTAPYGEIAARHRMTEGAVKAAAHRLRQQFRAALRDAIAETVADENDIDDEIRHLFAVFEQS
jgi:RNA polymerase sigma factor (sigma-70 family)